MHLSIWTSFFIIQFVLAATLSEEKLQPIFKDAQPGSTITVKTTSYDNFLRCTLQLPAHLENSGKEFEFYPDRDKDLPKNIQKTFLISGCSVDIENINDKEVGKWIMRSYVHKSQESIKITANLVMIQEFTIGLAKEVESFPNRDLTTAEGNNVFIRLKDPIPNMVNCSIRNPEEKLRILWHKQEKSRAVFTSTEPVVEFWDNRNQDECGAVIRNVRNDTVSGKWKLEAVDENSIVYKSTIYITIHAKNHTMEEYPKENILTLGTDQTVDITPKNAIWCRATPEGSNKSTNCQISFKPVKKSDSKKWHVSWLTSTSVDVLEDVVEFFVREPRYINTSVKAYQNKQLLSYNLMCSMRSQGIQHCVFERPDGKILNLKPGTGTGRYSYYGKGFSTSSYEHVDNECGLTIEKLEKEDIGIWKCSLNDANIDKKLTADVSFLAVDQNLTNKIISHTNNRTVETIVSGNIIIWCKIRSSLDYCLIEHPDGFKTFKPNASTPVDIFDLRSGLCGVQIYNLTKEDAGDWSCRMGIKNGSEYLTKYTIHIYDKQIVSSKDIKLNENNSPSITCRTLNNIPLSYCKFTRHDGFSLHTKNKFEDGYEFTGNLTNGLCNMTISKTTSKDMGVWKCSAGLLDENEEISTAVQLSKSKSIVVISTISLEIILIIIIGVAVIIIAMTLVFYKYGNILSPKFKRPYSRNSMVKPNDPIPHYLPADSPIPTET